MKRRFLLELEISSKIPGAALEILMRLAGEMERMREEHLIVGYSIGLETDVTWFVRTAAEITKNPNLGHGAAEESIPSG